MSEEASSTPAEAPPLRLPAELPATVAIAPVATLSGHKDRVWCVAWHPSENVLASASGDTTVRLWGEVGGRWAVLAVLEREHEGTVRHVSWSPIGEYIACASFDRTATVWRRSSDDGWEFEIEGVLDGHESEVKCVAWATETTLATCSRDHTVWVWDRVNEGEYECAGVLAGHSQDVKYCTWLMPTDDAQRPLIVSCGYDETVRVWGDSHRSDDWQCAQTLKGHEGTVWAAAPQRLEPTMVEVRAAEAGAAPLPQPLLATCADDRRVLFWRRDGQGRFHVAATAAGFCERTVFQIGWAPGGAALLACAGGDNSVTLLGLSMDGGGEVHVRPVARVLDAHRADVNTVAFAYSGAADSDEGLLLASGGDDGVVKLWRVTAHD